MDNCGKRGKIKLNGGTILSPRSTGKNNIYNQFNEASGQAKRLVVDCTRSPQSYESVCKQAHDGLMRRKDFTDVYVVNHEEIKHYSKN